MYQGYAEYVEGNKYLTCVEGICIHYMCRGYDLDGWRAGGEEGGAALAEALRVARCRQTLIIRS